LGSYKPRPNNISELKVTFQSIWSDLPQDPIWQIHSEFHRLLNINILTTLLHCFIL